MLKKMLTCVIATTMVLSMCVPVFAADNRMVSGNMETPLDVEFVDSMDEIETKNSSETSVSDLVMESSLPAPAGADLSGKQVTDGIQLEMPSTLRSANSVTQSWTGTIAQEGTFVNVVVTLAPTQILNASLECPKNPNLNYDLYVYEVNPNGTLGNMVSASITDTHINQYEDGTSKTLDEGAAYINTTAQTKNYAIIVLSEKGASTTDSFKLTASLDVYGEYDAAEPNDSPYYAYGISAGTTTGTSLHVPNDQDWFTWNAPSDVTKARIAATRGYKVEVYTAIGNKMVLSTKKSDDVYSIAPGVNYIRVFADGTGFVSGFYELRLEGQSTMPAIMNVTMNGDDGDDSYPSYPEGRYFRFRNKFYPKVTILSASGYPVPDHSVTLFWQSESWNGTNDWDKAEVTGSTDSKGEVILLLEAPKLSPSLGTHAVNLPGGFTHYYDIDAIGIAASGVSPFVTLVYHLARG